MCNGQLHIFQHEGAGGLRGTLALYARVWRGGRERETSLFSLVVDVVGKGERGKPGGKDKKEGVGGVVQISVQYTGSKKEKKQKAQ